MPDMVAAYRTPWPHELPPIISERADYAVLPSVEPSARRSLPTHSATSQAVTSTQCAARADKVLKALKHERVGWLVVAGACVVVVACDDTGGPTRDACGELGDVLVGRRRQRAKRRATVGGLDEHPVGDDDVTMPMAVSKRPETL